MAGATGRTFTASVSEISRKLLRERGKNTPVGRREKGKREKKQGREEERRRLVKERKGRGEKEKT